MAVKTGVLCVFKERWPKKFLGDKSAACAQIAKAIFDGEPDVTNELTIGVDGVRWVAFVEFEQVEATGWFLYNTVQEACK